MNRNLESIRNRSLAVAIPLAVALAANAAEPQSPTPRLSESTRPLHYEAKLRLDPRQPDFEGTIEIRLAVDEATDLLWLNGTALDVETATLTWEEREIEAEPVAGNEDFVGFRFPQAIGPGEGTLTVGYRGTFSEEPRGLFRRKLNGDWYLFSRFQPMHARRAFPCFDEPRYPASWTLTLDVPAEMTAMTNTMGMRARTRLTEAPPPVAADSAAGGEATAPPKRRLVPSWTWIRYAETPQLPSHRVALAVGPFDAARTERVGSKKTVMRIFTPRDKAAETAHLQRILPRILESLEAERGTPYPYGKLDLLVFPATGDSEGVNAPGLVDLAERLLIAADAQEAAEVERRAAAVLTRELARQWPDPPSPGARRDGT